MMFRTQFHKHGGMHPSNFNMEFEKDVQKGSPLPSAHVQYSASMLNFGDGLGCPAGSDRNYLVSFFCTIYLWDVNNLVTYL